jgi:protein TonB
VIDMRSPIIRNGIQEIQSAVHADAHSDPADFSGLWRWLVGTVVLVPILLAAGVYWLHQQPSGPSARSGDATIHVELIQTPGPAAEFKQASTQTSSPIADFRTVPSIAEPSQPSYEQEAVIPVVPATPSRPAPAPQQKPANAGQAQPTPAGAAFRFQRLLLAHIERYQRYPKAARRDGLQGTVLVVFAMRRDGSVVQVGVKSSSGRPILDQEAMETIRRAQPLPPIPADMPEQLTVLLPVAFDAP